MKKANKKVNAAIIIIGNEILSGRTQDINVSFLEQQKRLLLDIKRYYLLNLQNKIKNNWF